MGAEDLQKKLKRKKEAIKNATNPYETESRELFHNDENLSKVKGEKKKKKSLDERKRNKNKANNQVDEANVSVELEKSVRGKKNIKISGNNKRKKDKMELTESKEEEKRDNEIEDGIEEENTDVNVAEEHKKRKSKKKRSENLEASRLETKNQVDGSDALDEADNGTNIRTRKSKKARKAEKMEPLPSKDVGDLLKKSNAEDEVYQMSSGDEDSSKGMKKWIMEYNQSRPGLKVLQQRIDDFITAHEEQEEQAREEREAQAAEGGWTVVVHHKGRKKTTEIESGVAVGSVAQAAVLDKMAKKKNKDVGLDFYRFQKREAHRNEIMMLQSKFEQDKKRIQQLRAQRKFRPY